MSAGTTGERLLVTDGVIHKRLANVLARLAACAIAVLAAMLPGSNNAIDSDTVRSQLRAAYDVRHREH